MSGSTGVPTSYQVQFALAGSGNFVNGPTITAPTVTALITGLQQPTAYDFRVEAVNSAGASAPSTVVTSSTLPTTMGPVSFQFLNTFGRIRALTIGPDNLCYFSTSNTDGRGTPLTGDDHIYKVDLTQFTGGGGPGPNTPAVVAANLNVPWKIAFLPDGSMLVTERDTFNIVHLSATGAVLATVGVPNTVTTTAEGGLMGLAIDPSFSTNNFIYISHSINYNGGYTPNGNEVARYTYNPTSNVLAGYTQLLTYDANNIHNGGGVAIGPDGMLYVTVGNANAPAGMGSGPYPEQDTTNTTNGKILRVTTSGGIPPDNPFGNAVWTYGHRNPQGLFFQGNVLWATEQGPSAENFGTITGTVKGNDKINILVKGNNYGFPVVWGPNTTVINGVQTIAPMLTSGDSITWAPNGIVVFGNSVFAGALGGVGLTGTNHPSIIQSVIG